MVRLQGHGQVGRLPDHYRTLGVEPTASFAEIQRAYWAASLRRSSTADQRDLNEAYEVLGNEQRRREYDALRAEAGIGAEAGAKKPPEPEAPKPAQQGPTLRSKLGWPSI